MKESYIKLPNITVSKLQDVIDYLDENNIEYIEEYKRDEEINRLNNIIDELEDLITIKISRASNEEDYDIEIDDMIELKDKLNELRENK